MLVTKIGAHIGSVENSLLRDSAHELAEVPPVILPNATDISLDLPSDLPWDAWLHYARYVNVLERAHQWWIGDLLNNGERFGDRAIQAVAELDFDPRTLINTKSIASRFPKERRRRDLSFNHHAAVAYLDPSKADELLEQAAIRHWTIRELREVARESQVRARSSSNAQAVLKAVPPRPQRELTSRRPEDSHMAEGADRPTQTFCGTFPPCPADGHTRFWLTTAGAIVCGRCGTTPYEVVELRWRWRE